jgi:hypothetical protein
MGYLMSSNKNAFDVRPVEFEISEPNLFNNFHRGRHFKTHLLIFKIRLKIIFGKITGMLP